MTTVLTVCTIFLLLYSVGYVIDDYRSRRRICPYSKIECKGEKCRNFKRCIHLEI